MKNQENMIDDMPTPGESAFRDELAALFNGHSRGGQTMTIVTIDPTSDESPIPPIPETPSEILRQKIAYERSLPSHDGFLDCVSIAVLERLLDAHDAYEARLPPSTRL